MSNDFCFAIINPLLRRVNQSCYVIVYWEMIYSTEHGNLKRSRQTRLKNQSEINNRLMCNVMLILLEEQIKKSQWVIGHFKKLVGGKPKFPNVSQKTAVYSCRNIPKAFQDSFDNVLLHRAGVFQSLHKTVRGRNVLECKLMYSLIHNNDLMISRRWPSIHRAWSKTPHMPRCDEVHVALPGSQQMNWIPAITSNCPDLCFTLITWPLFHNLWCLLLKSTDQTKIPNFVHTRCHKDIRCSLLFAAMLRSHDKLIDTNKSGCFYNGTAQNAWWCNKVHRHCVQQNKRNNYLDISTWTQFLF